MARGKRRAAGGSGGGDGDSGGGGTVGECLATIGLSAGALAGCDGLQAEWAAIKKAYFKAVLAAHPDKGGDPATFRAVQGAFAVLRQLLDAGGLDSFADAANTGTGDAFGSATDDAARTGPPPSWDFYAAAAEEPVPRHRVEPARSARSTCAAKGVAKRCTAAAIGKGDLRVGSLDPESGSYRRWVHLACWRVPSKVWLGLPDPDACTDPARFEAALLSMSQVLLDGVAELAPDQRAQLVAHAMDKGNWARLARRKPQPDATAAGGDGSAAHAPTPKKESTAKAKAEAETKAEPKTKPKAEPKTKTKSEPKVKPKTEPKDEDAATGAAGASSSGAVAGALATKPKPSPGKAVVPRGAKREARGGAFVMPVPGRGAAQPNSLAGQTVVLTGVFPEVGGGAGLNLGKDKVKRMVEAFGGRVTSSVSGKTSILLVGKEPGFSKVSQARGQPNCRLMSLRDLKGVVEGGAIEDAAAKPMVIDDFSSGYRGNGLASHASALEYQAAATGGLTDGAEAATPRKRKALPASKPRGKRAA
mmetsp:Transcript_1994/g.4970  ORF Transcript_1994/g.4970 Transcript_1994/m.4970 type:complete len:532 (+) Transcript_1994:162-1757(+)